MIQIPTLDISLSFLRVFSTNSINYSLDVAKGLTFE